ncbi:microtubule-binding protein MIP-T3-domain-containing protein [Pelagophyceae sp. CCMP2097]|nr:microtubule-binding protein MIP-T3-domain-containing protein [Pelagophyceae sp. CCMP2097]
MSLEELIAQTQAVLQPLIERPVLKEKLLSKPPFRFLHDVITAVTKATGFAEGLYGPEELDAAAIGGKEQKLAYLAKIISCVGICKGSAVDVRAPKVVAGLEPEGTNLLLQALAEVAGDSQLDFGAAVRLALDGSEPGGVAVPRKGGGGRESKAEPEEDAKAEPPRDAPPASRGGARGRDDRARDGGLGGPTSAAGPAGGLDEQIEACDGSAEATKLLLGAVISKPKLADKLLAKPPFRFLHDVISAVSAATGFGEGLYDETERDSAALTDKQAKVDYLAKTIKLVGFQLNTIVEARPQKIVSGLEPENTNRFLQLLAVAATAAPDSQKAVQAVLSGGDFAGGAPQEAAQAKEEPPPREKPQPREPPPQARRPADDEAQSKSEPPATFASAAKDEKGEEGDDGGGAQPKRSTRPTTARRRPPKAKAKVDDDDSGAKAAPPSKIIVDGEGDEESDGEEEEAKDLGAAAAPTAEGKSKLVRQIQEEERLAAARKGAAGAEAKESGGGVRFGRIDQAAKGKAGGAPEADLAELQATIQALCQSTNPLGKCMDYVHEDLETMNKELEKWAHNFRADTDELDRERATTSAMLKPLHAQLAELEDKLADEIKGTRAVKARVLKHEERVADLLRMVCTSGNK